MGQRGLGEQLLWKESASPSMVLAMIIKSEICILGSSFGASILAWALARAGKRVVMVDRAAHPRFAIGESSTPLADFLLELIADRFDLHELRPLSRWGTWQNTFPQLRCGKKRGFSYFAHRSGEPFSEGLSHEQSLLVAASSSDDVSDTHWMRSDVDAWLFRQAEQAGVRVLSKFELRSVEQAGAGWHLEGSAASQDNVQIECGFLVDSTGGGRVLGNALEIPELSDHLQTRTSAIFGHFENVRCMTEYLQAQDIPSDDDPFDADDAAQHHVLGASGWMWMLRFQQGVTSVGLVQAESHWPRAMTPAERLRAWRECIAAYPTLTWLLRNARLIAPDHDGQTQLGFIPRISRLWGQAAGTSWAMLPGTVGIVDPLHSTGIAHALHGVLRLATILTQQPATEPRGQSLQQYSRDVVSEIRWIDRIVSACYLASQRSFRLFGAVCSLYFVAAIHSERELSETGVLHQGFLLWRCEALRTLADETAKRLAALPQWDLSGRTESEQEDLVEWLREQLAPWNDVGLLDPKLHNRIARSTAR